jgi:hypothetical protein
MSTFTPPKLRTRSKATCKLVLIYFFVLLSDTFDIETMKRRVVGWRIGEDLEGSLIVA